MSKKVIKRIVRVVRHFTPEVWPWETELWKHRLLVQRDFYHLGQRLAVYPHPPVASRPNRLALLEAVGVYLRPLSSNPACWKEKRPWRNLDMGSPNGPIGSYHWSVAAQMVVCVRRAEKTLFDGWNALGNERRRDGSPYLDPVRDAEWDTGYMLAHGYHYERKKLMEWLTFHERRIANGAPALLPDIPTPAHDL